MQKTMLEFASKAKADEINAGGAKIKSLSGISLHPKDRSGNSGARWLNIQPTLAEEEKGNKDNKNGQVENSETLCIRIHKPTTPHENVSWAS